MLRIIKNDNLFKSNKGFYKPTINILFKLKREKIKKSLYKPVRKNLFRSKIEEIKEILHDPIINRDEKIEEIKNILYDPRINLLEPEKDHYKPLQIGIAFSSNYTEYKSNGDKDKTSIKDYVDEIKPYLSDMINDNKTQGKWKVHLTMTINFFSSKDSEETRTMYSKIDNIEVMMADEIDKIIEDLLDSFLQRHQKNLEKSTRGSESVFDCVDSLYYKLHKISLNRGGSYKDSPKWLKKIRQE